LEELRIPFSNDKIFFDVLDVDRSTYLQIIQSAFDNKVEKLGNWQYIDLFPNPPDHIGIFQFLCIDHLDDSIPLDVCYYIKSILFQSYLAGVLQNYFDFRSSFDEKNYVGDFASNKPPIYPDDSILLGGGMFGLHDITNPISISFGFSTEPRCPDNNFVAYLRILFDVYVFSEFTFFNVKFLFFSYKLVSSLNIKEYP
jgi:hypothetical protein